MMKEEDYRSHDVDLQEIDLPPVAGDRKPIVKQDLPTLKGRGFVLYNVLSPEECEHYIRLTDSTGYKTLEGTGYRPDYRNNHRLIVLSNQLSQLLFERVKEFLPQEVVVEPNTEISLTSELGTSGVWRPKGMNECWRFCKYYPGGHFGPHLDGNFVRNDSERSIYTFMIYLNGGFEGGETNFLDDEQKLFRDPQTGIMRGEEQNYLDRVKPEAGLALIFQHPIMHEGGQLKSGSKYILRSEVMFERLSVATDHLDEKEIEARRLFRLASSIEHENALEAANLYRRAFKLSPSLAVAYRS